MNRPLPPWLPRLAGALLGVLFLLAAWPKVVDPPGFAKTLWAYGLFPAWTLAPLALVLPWLEALSGLCLLLGIWARAAATWTALLLVGFILALGINLARHRPVDCGCFRVGQPPRTEAARLADMRMAILRDLGMLVLAALVLRRRERFPTGRRPG